MTPLTQRCSVATCLVLLLLAGAGVRMIRLDEPPEGFWTVRQYNTPIMARAMYYEELPNLPDWKREVARAQWLNAQHGEPPIMQWIAVRIFHRIGHEAFWPMRIQAVLAWVGAGLFLFLIARDLLGARAGLVACAFHLFLPYGVIASRSLQHDPLMVMSLLASLWVILRYHQQPSSARWWICALASAATIWIKPGVSQFAISATYLFLSLYRDGLRKTLTSPQTYLFYVIAAFPGALYIGLQSLSDRPLTGFFTWNVRPALLATVYLWKGWLGILLQIFGLAGLFLGLWGLLTVPRGWARVFVLGFGAGYVAQCCFTTSSTASHDYWHLQAVPLLALGVGHVGAILWERGAQIWSPVMLRSALTIVSAAWIGLAMLVGPLKKQRVDSSFDYIRVAQEIGEKVNHSTNVVYLDYDMGITLKYYALLDGHYWPETAVMDFLEAIQLKREPDSKALSASERFERFYAERQPEYFVILRALGELDAQPGLRDFLYSNFPVHAQGNRYLIFDLRKRL